MKLINSCIVILIGIVVGIVTILNETPKIKQTLIELKNKKDYQGNQVKMERQEHKEYKEKVVKQIVTSLFRDSMIENYIITSTE